MYSSQIFTPVVTCVLYVVGVNAGSSWEECNLELQNTIESHKFVESHEFDVFGTGGLF